MLIEVLRDLLLLGCVAVFLYGGRWVAWKLGWVPETGFVVRMVAEHARAVLRKQLGFAGRSDKAFEEVLHREGFEVRFEVDVRSRTLCHVGLAGEDLPDTQGLELAFGEPAYLGARVFAWVDPQKPLETLPWLLDLAHAAQRSGPWAALITDHELQAQRSETGETTLQGTVHGRSICLTQSPARGLQLQAEIPQTLRVVLGRGQTGNPVMDMLVDAQGLPPGSDEAVLSLVHGHGARMDGGALQVTHRGPLMDLWPAVEVLLAALAQTPEDPS